MTGEGDMSAARYESEAATGWHDVFLQGNRDGVDVRKLSHSNAHYGYPIWRTRQRVGRHMGLLTTSLMYRCIELSAGWNCPCRAHAILRFVLPAPLILFKRVPGTASTVGRTRVHTLGRT